MIRNNHQQVQEPVVIVNNRILTAEKTDVDQETPSASINNETQEVLTVGENENSRPVSRN